MNTVDLILSIISQRGITKAKLLADTGLNRNSFVNWRKLGTHPKSDDLTKIANYLGVTVDYLLGRDTPSGLSLSPDEEELVRCYRRLNNDGKKKMNDYLDDLLGNEKNLSVPTASAVSAG